MRTRARSAVPHVWRIFTSWCHAVGQLRMRTRAREESAIIGSGAETHHKLKEQGKRNLPLAEGKSCLEKARKCQYLLFFKCDCPR